MYPAWLPLPPSPSATIWIATPYWSIPGRHDDKVRQLIRIGFDRVHGFLAGGIEAWKSAGLPVEITITLELDDLRQAQDLPAAPMVIDVRHRSEYAVGHIPGALNIELGELQEHLDGLPREQPVVTVCAAGMRATTGGHHPAARRQE